MAPRQVVVLIADRDDHGGDGAVHPQRADRAQLNIVRERRPKPARNGLADVVGVRVGQLERHDHLAILHDGDDAQAILGGEHEAAEKERQRAGEPPGLVPQKLPHQ